MTETVGEGHVRKLGPCPTLSPMATLPIPALSSLGVLLRLGAGPWGSRMSRG